MCKDLGALAYLSVKENKDSGREGNSKRMIQEVTRGLIMTLEATIKILNYFL